MADTPDHAAAASMLARFPKAELQSRGVGFRWEDFLPALEAAVKVARAEEREACAQLAEQEATRAERIGVTRIVALRHVADLIRARGSGD